MESEVSVLNHVVQQGRSHNIRRPHAKFQSFRRHTEDMLQNRRTVLAVLALVKHSRKLIRLMDQGRPGRVGIGAEMA